MIIDHFEQGGIDWIEARLGIPTASNFKRILTPAGALSKSREPYMAELLAERVMGEPYVDFSDEWVDRGRLLEPDALRYYQFARDRDDVQKVGLVYPDERRLCGASPDALIGEDGGLELKCPSLPKHLKYLAEGVVPNIYWPQVQACLFFSGREWWDFLSYHPEQPHLLVRAEPDPDYHAAMRKHLPVFLDEIEALGENLKRLGVVMSGRWATKPEDSGPTTGD